MTIINTNSISGINSITAQGASGIEFYESSGVNQRLRIDGDGRLLLGTNSSYGSANSDDLTIGDRTQSEVGITLGATVASAIRFADAGNVSAGMIQYVHNSGGTDYLNFYTNGANERLRITSDGNIGINDISPSDALTVYKNNVGNPAGITIRNTNAGSTYSHARLRLESQNGAAYGEIWADVANAGLRLGYNSSSTVKIDSTGNIVLLSGRGIDFSATSDAPGKDNELLDDYEEGTWTPAIDISNNTTGITYAFQNGSYVKIGRLVTCYADLRLSSKGAVTGGIRLIGLPFTVLNVLPNTALEGGGLMTYQSTINLPNGGHITILPSQNSTTAALYKLNSSNGGQNGLANTDINNASDFRLTFSYPTT